jgi:hypothetical protein
LAGWLVWLGWLADVHPRCDDYRSLHPMHDLDGFRRIPESRISVDHGHRSNALRIMVSAQFCHLEALSGGEHLDFMSVFKAFVRTLKSSRKCPLVMSHLQYWLLL